MWVRDLAHNPDPLSPAQTELVARVDAAGLGARQRVEQGELFYWEEPATAESATGGIELEAAEAVVARLRNTTRAPAETLDEAISDYLTVYGAYTEAVRPAIRGVLRAFEATGLDGAQLLAGAAAQSCARDEALWELGQNPHEAALHAYQQRFGMYAPVWDVAVPCDAERRDRVLAMAALWRLRDGDRPGVRRQRAVVEAENAAATLPSAQQALVLEARRAIALADLDDEIFFAAQQRVRRAWLDEGDPAALVVPAPPAPRSATEPAQAWQGKGVGWGQAQGRVRVVRSLHELPTDLPADTILVMPAFLPSHTFLLAIVRAIIVETGGLLSHAAIVAREYGVPYLVGVRGATALPDGSVVHVDGDGGRVYGVGGRAGS